MIKPARDQRLDAEQFHPESPDDWHRWLGEHHGTSSGVWLVPWKARTGRPAVGYEEESFPRSARRAVLEWIAQAKRPETRSRRVREAAERAARGERANQRPV